MDLNHLFFKYFVYYPVVVLRGEWIYPHLKRLRRSQYWSRQQLEQHQLEKLNKLLAHAREHVPYYRNILPPSLSRLNELSSLPLLEKAAIREQFSSFLSDRQPLLHRDKTTGGSTGAPVTVRKDSRSMAHELAATWRGYEWAGIDVGDRQARFWGVPMEKSQRLRARLIDLVTNRRRVSAFNFSDAALESYTNELEKFQPKYFYGYVSMLREFAEFVRLRAYSARLRPQAVITTSEVLTESDRHLLAEVFQCRVFNEYGCGELGTIAHECEHGRLHLSAENMIVEIVGPDGAPVPAGQPGEIVVTELNNFSMPLIRYRMRDFGVLSNEACPCGRTLPVLGGIHGREYDILQNTRGDRFHGEFFLYMVEDLKRDGCAIRGVQFVQPAVDRLTIRLVVDEQGFKHAVEILTKQIKDRFDDGVLLAFERVNEILRESSGKLRVIKRDF